MHKRVDPCYGRSMKKTDSSKKVHVSHEGIFRVWGWIVIVWALYRYFGSFPEWVDELIAKPLVFVAPVIWYTLRKAKGTFEDLGISFANVFTSIYIGLGFGMVFALEGLAANAIKYGKLQITPIDEISQYGLLGLLALSLATAVSEEILSRGFVFKGLLRSSKSLVFASLLSTCMFVLLHVPILVTSLHLSGTALVLFLVTDFVLGVANSLLVYNTGTLIAPILVHIFWNMTVALYL